MQALTPTVDQWRNRIAGLTKRFEAVKGQELPALQAARSELESAASHMQGAVAAEQQVLLGVARPATHVQQGSLCGAAALQSTICATACVFGLFDTKHLALHPAGAGGNAHMGQR